MPSLLPSAPLAPLPETRRAAVLRLVRSSLGSGVAVGGRAAAAVLLNKLLAVYGGPGGLTLLAHFQNLMALLTALPNEGVHVGLVKYLAPLRPGSGRYRSWLGAGLVLNAGLLLLGAGVLGVGHQVLLTAFHPTVGWLSLLLLGTALLTANGLLVAVLLAKGRLRAYVGLTVLSSGLGVGWVAVALGAGHRVEQALLGYLLAQSLVVGPAWVVCYRSGLLPRLRQQVSGPAVRGLGRFVLMALSVLLFSKAVDFELRNVLIVRFHLAETDLWQAVVKLSDNYTMVFSALASSVYYPRLAALTSQPAALRAYLRTLLLLLAPTLAVGLGLLFLLRDWLLPLLYDSHLAAARYLLWPQLLGDWAKLLCWVLLFLLTAHAQVGRYLAVQAASAVLYVGLLAMLVPRYGLLGAPLAHAARYLVLLAGCGWYFRAYWQRQVV